MPTYRILPCRQYRSPNSYVLIDNSILSCLTSKAMPSVALRWHHELETRRIRTGFIDSIPDVIEFIHTHTETVRRDPCFY